MSFWYFYYTDWKISKLKDKKSFEYIFTVLPFLERSSLSLFIKTKLLPFSQDFWRNYQITTGVRVAFEFSNLPEMKINST